ncbi:MAG: hypothetical protein LUI09_04225 [Prevotellaceae bacterium]|nr:hypothetical protein [Prevotellaceae bacterium]
MPTLLTTKDLYPHPRQQNYQDVRSEEQCQALFREHKDTPIERVAFHNIALPEEALQHEFRGCIFLSCKMPHGLKRKFTDSLVFPDMGELFRFQSTLYTAETLYEGYEQGKPETMKTCYDGLVYQHYLQKGKRATDVKETLARTLHDHSISSALHEFLSPYREEDIVGVMGGHGISRLSRQYEDIALISKRLTEEGKLMISGGGPGAMEATHLGALMAGRSDGELQEALETLRTAPEFTDPRWLDTAFTVRRMFPQHAFESVGIPTWLYGHEPATPLATRIAKYFDNSIREDGILSLACGGVIYTPGSAGTLQEIFQDAVQNHYLSLGYASPMVFYSRQYWLDEVPVYPLIQELISKGKYLNLLTSLSDRVEDICQAILTFTPARG